ncbi:hypothetical protein IID26_00845 [Patescibacteria group bacterium]|nr:hypothetical protein [Patescibacteria group bacterium]
MLLFVDTVFAQSYTPISPLPGVGSSVNTGGPSGLVQYFNNIFVLFISIIAVLAVIKLMICGFQYMMSEAISSKEAAKKCMTGVFGGLLIVLLSVLVLQTINPKILSFDFFGTLQDKVGGVVSGIELDDRSRAEEAAALTGYANRVIIDQGFCFVGDDAGGFADIECGSFGFFSGEETIWTTLEQCLAGEEEYKARPRQVFISYGIEEGCFSTADGSRGIGREFCYDITTSVGSDDRRLTQQQCPVPVNDSLLCEQARRDASSRPLFVSATPCYRPGAGG